MQGKIIKGIAGFYYVHVEAKGTYECKAKGIFRKDHVKPLVGDDVLVDLLDEEEKLGNIRETECAGPSGRCQRGSGTCHICHCQTESQF